ncbi:MAG: hypothetical protein JSV35_00280 [Candidatus Bathyarchaeota archaeon]|nr:MAG: hypothetical protein JSV35_00280 [Candidatus Bathyarchaeota archaeon]
MNEEDDSTQKTKRLAQFKALLEKRITDQEEALKDLRNLHELVSEVLLEKGFRRAKLTPSKPPRKPPTIEEPVKGTPLKTKEGDLLGTFFLKADSLRVVPSEGTGFNVKIPPFQQFLIERVLAKMRDKDQEAANKGLLQPENIFSYEVVTKEDRLQEIIIRPVSAERLRELKSSIRWTLEKMYEKRNPE